MTRVPWRDGAIATMQRRKFIIGMGALASGTAAAVGSGAFSQITAERDFDLEIVTDDDAYLALEPGSGIEDMEEESAQDNDYVYTTGDADFVAFDVTALNSAADTVIENALEITNQSDRTQYVWAPGGVEEGTGADSVEVVYDGTDITWNDSDKPRETPGTILESKEGGSVEIEVGESKEFDLRFLVSGEGGTIDETGGSILLRAEPDEPENDDWDLE